MRTYSWNSPTSPTWRDESRHKENIHVRPYHNYPTASRSESLARRLYRGKIRPCRRGQPVPCWERQGASLELRPSGWQYQALALSGWPLIGLLLEGKAAAFLCRCALQRLEFALELGKLCGSFAFRRRKPRGRPSRDDDRLGSEPRGCRCGDILNTRNICYLSGYTFPFSSDLFAR